MNQAKRLFFDIETSPNIGFFWTAGYRQTISHENIIKERAIICICYKWAGDEKIYSLNWDDEQSDKQLLESFILVANEADELVGHNGDRFDLPWIRTRCLYHRIPVFPNYTTLDTLKHARSKFRFNSNKLDYIAKFLGVGQKIHTSYDLWKKVILDKDEESLQYMIEYCKKDVLGTLELYHKLESHEGMIFTDGSSSKKYKIVKLMDSSTTLKSIKAKEIATNPPSFNIFEAFYYSYNLFRLFM
jgi:uncharacterized protein YprB with RNaseH-like and TPR domain